MGVLDLVRIQALLPYHEEIKMDRKADILYGIIFFLLGSIVFGIIMKYSGMESIFTAILVYLAFKFIDLLNSISMYLIFSPKEENKE